LTHNYFLSIHESTPNSSPGAFAESAADRRGLLRRVSIAGPMSQDGPKRPWPLVRLLAAVATMAGSGRIGTNSGRALISTMSDSKSPVTTCHRSGRASRTSVGSRSGVRRGTWAPRAGCTVLRSNRCWDSRCGVRSLGCTNAYRLSGRAFRCRFAGGSVYRIEVRMASVAGLRRSNGKERPSPANGSISWTTEATTASASSWTPSRQTVPVDATLSQGLQFSRGRHRLADLERTDDYGFVDFARESESLRSEAESERSSQSLNRVAPSLASPCGTSVRSLSLAPK